MLVVSDCCSWTWCANLDGGMWTVVKPHGARIGNFSTQRIAMGKNPLAARRWRHIRWGGAEEMVIIEG